MNEWSRGVANWLGVAPGAFGAGDSVLDSDARARGERLVAGLRLALLLVFLPAVVFRPPGGERWVGIAIYAVALINALAIRQRAQRQDSPWLSVYSIGIDISTITAGLAAFLLLGRPLAMLNSGVLFDGYFLCLVCAGLRFEWRLSLYAMALVLVQYACLAAVAIGGFDLGRAFAEDPWRGAFQPAELIGRMAALVGAGVLGTAVALLGARWRTLSAFDPLTGLMNRGHFVERAEAELARAARLERALAVAILDVDHFKAFNELYGHAGGDAALVVLAGLLKRAFRRSDLVARLGGDEFLVLMPDTSMAQALARLEALRGRIAAQGLGGGEGRVTISSGVARWPDDGAALTPLLARADLRTLEAKRAGRNRVVGPPAEEPLLPPGPPFGRGLGAAPRA